MTKRKPGPKPQLATVVASVSPEAFLRGQYAVFKMPQAMIGIFVRECGKAGAHAAPHKTDAEPDYNLAQTPGKLYAVVSAALAAQIVNPT